MSDPSLTAQAEALLERIPDYSRLDRNDVACILTLHKAGKTQVEIAHILGCDQSNISRWLAKLTDTTELAKHTLRAGATRLAERVIAEADVEQSLEVLDRLDVAPRKERNSNASTGVTIVVGQPGHGLIQPPVIDLSPDAFASDAPEQGAASD